MLKKAIRNPYFIFLPFLFFYAFIIFINKWPKLYGDEIRYADFAWNLLHGYYSPKPPHINLWNGPGYPLLLVPFMALRIHALYITLLNAVFQYLAVVFLYKALRSVTNNKIALIFSLLLAIYPNVLAILPILYTEAFTGFLISSIIYSITLCYTRGKARYTIITGLLLGYLTLTKVIFGYVLVLSLVACLIVLLFKRNRPYNLRMVKILLIAFAVTIPYLAYTYKLTGKLFYWGNSGGMSLYWMSTPYENEYGDWKVPDLSNHQYPILFKSAEADALLKKNHAKEVNFILQHNEVEQDILFKQAAIKNIKNSPIKFAVNYYYNVSRMLFNFPYSYSYQDSAIVGNIIRGSLILWASLAGIICTVLNWRKIIYPVKFILLITGVYLLLSGALSAYPRQLDVIVPALLFWTGFLAFNLPKIRLRFKEQEGLEDIKLSDLNEIDIYAEE
ncbi:ArnT family glycosyltransferase [Mucilaginibacter sp. X4EP1]|uniref:ArnT family glycosyltransferase n=1 Tax=Mucilaginibacter sp. X4EP1 TaxID=2723092 RepID=UPI0021670852|nr:glycosyltransferase family 39 protein [Mucilaginibacter sp. X4EP1]MCS3812392.1 4-amino-4-deoxy-L-arabinose transferase-like glycosyltransferase [Mucilaginibacter sp. X4EP1]